MEVLITLQKKFSKVSDRKSKKLVRLVIRTSDDQNRHLKKIRYGYLDHQISKCPNPPGENEKQKNQVGVNETYFCSCDNVENNNNQKIYASMARMSVNDECPSGNLGDSLQ